MTTNTANDRAHRTLFFVSLILLGLTLFATYDTIHGKEIPKTLVNVNTATAEELQTLPRVGPKLAEKIIAGRPYANLEALDAVKGIGEKMLAALKPLVSF